MTLAEIQAKLKNLKDRGYIPSLRRGSTGIGYTLEKNLNLSETNIPIPDIGGRVELKATRRNSSSLITLFTFNRGVWRIPQKLVIDEFGYIDDKGRKALKNTIWHGRESSQGLIININESEHSVNLIHRETEKMIASWDTYHLVSKFLSKLERLIFVLADSRLIERGKEEFHYNGAFLLQQTKASLFLESFKNSKIGIDLRMHLKENGVVRNRGTGFRIREGDFPLLYESSKELI